MSARKMALLEALRAHVAGEVATMRRLALDAAEAVTHEDNRPENDKDMRSTEASYIARGQATRVVELERDLNLLAALPLRDFADDEPVAIGALIEVEHGGKRTTYLMVPAGGGVTLSDGGKPVLTLTPQSPLGALLMRTSAGDEVEMAGPKGPRVYEIVAVR